MKIGVLTSSRADFGIYIPLLKQLQSDSIFKLEIIAFGTHLSKKHGFTITEIQDNNFSPIHEIETLLDSDTPKEMAVSIGKTCAKFADFWAKNKFDLVITLGDRYEMFAAVTAASPFNIKIAHIHAGETTLGAIDNAYRHAISLFSEYLFVSTEEYKKRAIEVVKQSAKVYNVGALSIDNLKNILVGMSLGVIIGVGYIAWTQATKTQSFMALCTNGEGIVTFGDDGAYCWKSLC